MSSGPFTKNGGTAIDVGKVVWTSLAVFAGAVFGGAADIVQSSFQAFLIGPLGGLADFLSSLVSGSWGTVTAAARGAWEPTIQFAGEFGVFSFAVSLAVVLLIAYILARGWQYA